MKTTLYALPYDTSAKCFHFTNAEEYETQAAEAVNERGDPVEELDIRFQDGSELDRALARTWRLHKGNVGAYFNAVETWDVQRKQTYIIAVGAWDFPHDEVADNPAFKGVEILPCSSLEGYARQLVRDGAFGEIPRSFRKYVDYLHIAADLSIKAGSTEIAGERVVYARHWD